MTIDLTVRVEVCLPSAHKYVRSSEGDLRIPCRAWTFQGPGSESAVDVPRATREVCGYLGHRGQDGGVVQMVNPTLWTFGDQNCRAFMLEVQEEEEVIEQVVDWSSLPGDLLYHISMPSACPGTNPSPTTTTTATTIVISLRRRQVRYRFHG
ncbi:hypothetical protein QJS10_CPB20g00690 [Acorus calamus]|uniref:Uncharacterized protein n=1 Tax=Acorus calamus TaxID=4465 RepID=A0AAV9CC65_ACOCL|nr:hypothetical protein QJS10_CPB20g00690 [Acorus calamus]